MDLQDVKSRFLIRVNNINPNQFSLYVRELNFSINSSWSEQSIVKDINPVGRHDNLDLISSLESIELIEQLEHGSLYL